ncbi:MAG: PQQ-binding-like beta-propeller repeat protein [Ginsengibacter sp.]
MPHKKIFLALVIFSGISCHKKNSPDQNNSNRTGQGVWVATQHNNNTRSGFNDQESILNVGNVNNQQFGKLFSLAVDDQVYSQPLIAGNIPISNDRHDVVYIATVNNTLYAYDGDTGELYWQKNFTAQGKRPPRNTDMTGACSGNFKDFSGNIGIVGTPVIDSTTQTIYFVARSTDGTNYAQYIHAVNILNGNEMPGSPVNITATYNGNGSGSINNILTFDPQKQNQRQALTLLNGIVYVSFASHCDWGPYHGWILGYNASTLRQEIVYNNTPNGDAGGIWESGMGMSADNQGNLYCVSGNGTEGINGDPTNTINRGESALKLTPTSTSLKVSSFFTPMNYEFLDSFDRDYGSLGCFLIPNSNYFFTGGKDGNLYLLNKDNMGGLSALANNVQQNIPPVRNASLHCQPSYYKGATNEFVYVWSENDNLRAYPFDRNTNLLNVSNVVMGSASGPTGRSGAVLSVSSKGTKDSTGILWASYASIGNANQSVCPGILRAFDANDITRELWNNAQNANDNSGNYAKFSPPTIANGHVYLATFSNQVIVYGLK